MIELAPPPTPAATPTACIAPLSSRYILGLRVDQCDYTTIFERFEYFIEQGGSHHVVLPNVEFCIAAYRDPEFNRLVNSCDLSIADGRGLHLAMRLAGSTLPNCTTGTDLGPLLAEWCRDHNRSLFLYGGEPGVAEAAAESLQNQFPGLRIAGTLHGFQKSAAEESEAVRIINATYPDILIVCRGMGRQEQWIRKHLHELTASVSFGNGGALDFWSGRIRRAPKWMQRAGLEWTFRLVLEPMRWRRQLALPHFAILFLWNLVLGRAFAPSRRLPHPTHPLS